MTAATFLENSEIYKLGQLTTESPHPMTSNLSELSQSDLPAAIATLKKVDLDALRRLTEYSDGIDKLAAAISKTLADGDRIFLNGCGATGRLALTIESIWRELNPGSQQVQAFMAGGDVALVHSLEGFEDFPEYGKKHAQLLNFGENDLMIAITEGGETPYVIGAAEYAATHSRRNAFFIYCNPNEDLFKVDRSKRVLENPSINKIELAVGPMALAGSTRMQASTVLQLAVGKALFGKTGAKDILEFIEHIENLDFSPLQDLIETEANVYRDGDFVMYSPEDFAITTFTDTTERSPTFSLPPFENPKGKNQIPSLCYISIPGTSDADNAWLKLLCRKPVPLNWVDIDKRTSESYLYDFDFSKNRSERIAPRVDQEFNICYKNENIELSLKNTQFKFSVKGLHPLFQHTLLKIILNTHSTLLMGKLNRYHSNIMTWVTPTNGKLIDRSARNIGYLLQQDGISCSYEEIVGELFEMLKTNESDQPVVVRTYNSLKQRISK